MIRRLYGLRIPEPLPIGAPSGITAAQPRSSRRRESTGSSFAYGQHHEAVVDQLLGGHEQLGAVGQQRVLVGDHLELDPVGLERFAGEPGGGDRVVRGVAAGGVGQDAPPGLRHDVQEGARSGRIQAAQRHRDDLGAGGVERPLEDLEARRRHPSP